MAEEEFVDDGSQEPKKRSIIPYLVMGIVLVVAVGAIAGVMFIKSEPEVVVEQPPAEYIVKDKMYQLQDGSYLKLGFSIVTAAEHLEAVKLVVEKEAPGRLPDAVTMVLGNRTRQDLIHGTHKREAFARELKKVLEERVFAEYNRRQISAKDAIEVKEVLISDFVTQPG